MKDIKTSSAGRQGNWHRDLSRKTKILHGVQYDKMKEDRKRKKN
ncbi:hypothetical protein [Pedobacter sp. R-06]